MSQFVLVSTQTSSVSVHVYFMYISDNVLYNTYRNYYSNLELPSLGAPSPYMATVLSIGHII